MMSDYTIKIKPQAYAELPQTYKIERYFATIVNGS